MANILADLALRLSAETAELKRNLQDARKDIKGVGSEVANLQKNFVKAFAGIGIAIVAGKKVFKELEQTINSTQKSGDSFAAMQKGLIMAQLSLNQAIATADFSNLISNMSSAYEAGKKYNNALDDLGDKTRAVSVANAELRKSLAELDVQIFSTTDETKKLEIIAEKQRLIQAQAIRLTAVKQEGYDIEIQKIKDFLKLNDDQIKQVEEYIFKYDLLFDSTKKADALYKALEKLNMMMGGLSESGRIRVEWTEEDIKAQRELIRVLKTGMSEQEIAWASLGRVFNKLTDEQRDALATLRTELSTAQTELIMLTAQALRQEDRFSKGVNKTNEELIDRLGIIGSLQWALSELAKELVRATDEQTITALNTEMTALRDRLAELAKLGEPKGLVSKINDAIATLEKERMFSNELSRIKEINKELENLRTRLSEMESPWENIGGITDKTGYFAKDKTSKQTPLAPMNTTRDGINAYPDMFMRLNETMESMETQAYLAATAISSIGDAIEGVFAGSADGLAAFATSMLGATRAIINELIKQAVVGMIAGESTKGLAGLITASIGISAIMGLIKKHTSKTATAFALGGIVSGPTVGMVGEYPGARSNPEVIAPLDKLKSLLGGQAMGGEVRFVIEQNKLVGILQGYNKKQLYF